MKRTHSNLVWSYHNSHSCKYLTSKEGHFLGFPVDKGLRGRPLSLAWDCMNLQGQISFLKVLLKVLWARVLSVLTWSVHAVGEHMVSFKALVNFTWSLPERRKDFLCEERPPSSEVAQWVKIPITKPGDPSTISGSHKGKQDSQKLSADLHMSTEACSSSTVNKCNQNNKRQENPLSTQPLVYYASQ